MPRAQADDSGLLGPLQSPNWVKVCLVSTVVLTSSLHCTESGEVSWPLCSNDNNNDFISIALFHVKHAQLR